MQTPPGCLSGPEPAVFLGARPLAPASLRQQLSMFEIPTTSMSARMEGYFAHDRHTPPLLIVSAASFVSRTSSSRQAGRF